MTPADYQALQQQLIEHEGCKLTAYRDSVGKVTIGVGRNLTDHGISLAEAMALLDHDLTDVQAGLLRRWPWMTTLDAIRFRVFIDLGFNLGLAGLARFVQVLAAAQRGDFLEAAAELRHSEPWATQVGARSVRLANMLERGAG